LRALIKYPVTLFILLLVGYTQLFAHLYTGTPVHSQIKNIRKSAHSQALVIKASEREDIYIEEEEKEGDERISLREPSRGSIHPATFYSSLQENLVLHTKNYFPQSGYFFRGFLLSPYLVFGVLRL